MHQMRVDEQTLASWSFLKDYVTHRAELLELAAYAHEATCSLLLRTNIQLEDCLEVYTTALLTTGPFLNMIRRKRHISVDFEVAFANIFARYVLDKNWSHIDTPCPPVSRAPNSVDQFITDISSSSFVRTLKDKSDNLSANSE